jgi:hypothetical protein
MQARGRFVRSAWAASGSDRVDGGVDAVGEFEVEGGDGVDGTGVEDEGDAVAGLFVVAAVIEVSGVLVDLVEQRRNTVGGQDDRASQSPQTTRVSAWPRSMRWASSSASRSASWCQPWIGMQGGHVAWGDGAARPAPGLQLHLQVFGRGVAVLGPDAGEDEGRVGDVGGMLQCQGHGIGKQRVLRLVHGRSLGQFLGEDQFTVGGEECLAVAAGQIGVGPDGIGGGVSGGRVGAQFDQIRAGVAFAQLG